MRNEFISGCVIFVTLYLAITHEWLLLIVFLLGVILGGEVET